MNTIEKIDRLRDQLKIAESALDNIACDPHKRANPQVFHNEWEEFSMQLVGYARDALKGIRAARNRS